VRDLRVDLPPGFVGNATAVGECAPAQFQDGSCSPSSLVGFDSFMLFPPFGGENEAFTQTSPVFNLSHPRGVISQLGFVVGGNPVYVKVSLDPANHYALTSTSPVLNETCRLQPETDPLGCPPRIQSTILREGCAEAALFRDLEAFLSLPSQCEATTPFACANTIPGSTPASMAPRSTTRCLTR